MVERNKGEYDMSKTEAIIMPSAIETSIRQRIKPLAVAGYHNGIEHGVLSRELSSENGNCGQVILRNTDLEEWRTAVAMDVVRMPKKMGSRSSDYTQLLLSALLIREGRRIVGVDRSQPIRVVQEINPERHLSWVVRYCQVGTGTVSIADSVTRGWMSHARPDQYEQIEYSQRESPDFKALFEQTGLPAVINTWLTVARFLSPFEEVTLAQIEQKPVVAYAPRVSRDFTNEDAVYE